MLRSLASPSRRPVRFSIPPLIITASCPQEHSCYCEALMAQGPECVSGVLSLCGVTLLAVASC